MEPFQLEATDDTPRIVFDPSNDTFEISGRSLPEDSTEFYDPVIQWIKAYAENSNEKSTFNFKLEYFNTASSKLILELLAALEEVDGCEVIWFYHDDDEDMQEAGEEYSELVDLKFDFETY